jgi:DNA-binding NarL/FixJ family response regulator
MTVDHTGAMANLEPSFTVVLVGDPDVCERLAGPIRDRASLLLTGIVTRDEAAATVVGRAPDVVVLVAAGSPGSDTAGLAADLGRALPASRLVVVVDDGQVVDPSALIDAWVGGIVAIDGPVALVDAIEGVACGEGLLDAGLAAAVLQRHHDGASSVALTATEEEVLRRLADGATVEALAAEYAVSPRLVRQHAGGALARLHPVA